MAAVFYLLCLYFTFKAYKCLSNNQKIIVFGWYLFATIGLFVYTNYLIKIGWEYGIPGADMLNYFKAGIALNNGDSWRDLATISPIYFAQLKLGTLMYFIFSSFVSILLRIPIINYQGSLYFIYSAFLLLNILSSINVSRILSQGKIKSRYLYTTLFCFGLIFASYRLLRDTILFYLITVAILYMKNHNTRTKDKVISILMMCACVIMRPYALFIVFPYFIVNFSKSKRSILYVVLIPIILVTVNGIFSSVLPYFNVTWDLSSFDIHEMINFLLFPNIFSQAKLLLIWNMVPHYSDYVAGCNLPGMYYAMSLWNFIVYPLVLFGIVYKLKDRIWDKCFWISILVSVCAVYSILYSTESGLETRHKIMILIPLVYFAGEGIELLSKIKISRYKISTFYPLIMLFAAIGVFFIC